jgi:energy-coupling factor transporter ATP-binding protein EcfA2
MGKRAQIYGRRLDAGAFVALVGPDGVGKTTVAAALIKMRTDRAAYFHFRPTLVDGLSATLPSKSSASPKFYGTGIRAFGWLRLLRNVLLFWIGYLMTVKPKVTQGTLVVGDRWAYGYIVQPIPLRFFGPAWMARLGVRLMPQPDLVACLVAPPETIRGRKSELTVDEISQELARYGDIPVHNLRSYDATSPPDHTARMILRDLGLDG